VHRDAALEYREIATQLRQEREEHNERAAAREMQQIDRDITAGGERIFAAARTKQDETISTEKAETEPQNRGDQQWREVRPDEVFEPGRQFRVSVDGSRSEVYEPTQRENPFDAMAQRDEERHDAAREMTDARKERPEPELSDLAKERMAMLGMQWNAEEREISQAQDRSRGGMSR
jgi:hypothetical protein